MIEIGRSNLFFGESTSGISEVIKFFDLIGKNCIYISSFNDISKHIFKNTCKVVTDLSNKINISKLINLIDENKFKVDIISLNLDHIDHNKTDIIKLIDLYQDIQFIFISTVNKTNFDNYNYVYSFNELWESHDTSSFGSNNPSFFSTMRVNLEIESIKPNKWNKSLIGLKESYIRNLKINDLLKDNEDQE